MPAYTRTAWGIVTAGVIVSATPWSAPAALPVITGRVTLLGNHATLRRSSAPGTPRFALLTVGLFGTPGRLVMSNVNISHGYPGITLDDGAAVISGGTFTGNSPAIGNYFSATLTVSVAAFTANTARYGGAINNYHPDLASLVVTGSTFTGNGASAGGAVYNYNAAILAGSSFTGDGADQGGAIDNDGSVTASGDRFTGNREPPGQLRTRRAGRGLHRPGGAAPGDRPRLHAALGD